jgi:hypothetical protein
MGAQINKTYQDAGVRLLTLSARTYAICNRRGLSTIGAGSVANPATSLA